MASSPGAVTAPPFPLDVATSDDLATALWNAIVRHDRTRKNLRTAIRNCVYALREQHMSPENMLVTMKALLRHTAAHDLTLGFRGPAMTEQWMAEMATWCIEDYFTDSESPPTTPG